MFNTNKCIKDLDAILSWVQWGDNRKYYKLWKGDPRITNKKKARQFLGYDTARDILTHDANLLSRTLFDLINEQFYSAYRDQGEPLSVEVLSDIGALPKIEELAEFLRPYGGMRLQEWLDTGVMHRTKSGKMLNLRDQWGDDDPLQNIDPNNKKISLGDTSTKNNSKKLKTYKNYVYFIFHDIMLGKFTSSFVHLRGSEKSNPKYLNKVNEAIKLFCNVSTRLADAWESWLHRNTSRLEKKLYDSQIDTYMADNNIDIVDPKKDGPVKSVAEIYTEWFKSMGSKYRIVPPDMKLDGGSLLIDKFNYVYVVMLTKFLEVKTKKYPDVGQDIRSWLSSNPLTDESGAAINANNIEDYYDKSFDEIKYPETSGTSVDFYNSKKSYSFVLKSEYTDKTTGETRVNEKTQEVGVTKVIAFVDEQARKAKNEALRKVCYQMNKIFLNHNLEKIPDDVKTCVVISCHEYDIVGQSTNRKNWHSCQDIYEGSYRGFVETGLQAGQIIAYYCDRDDTAVHTKGYYKTSYDSRSDKYRTTRQSKDAWSTNGSGKINISNPLGRVLIKPFVKKGEQQNFNDPNWVLVASKKYGEFPDDLIDKLQSWLDKNWNEDMIKKLGNAQDYDIAHGIYRDTPKERNGITM